MMRWYWAAFLLLGFLVPETIALIRRRPQDTLSDTVWRWCEVTPGSTMAHWTALHVFVALFMGWLWFHIVFGIWR
jgi:uncharacterized membrane protein YhaH (DUF805 family)